MNTIVTNNSQVKERFEGKTKNLSIEYLEAGSCMDVLLKVRDYIHRGCRLETHPMAGSVKPNQNPYKSVMISDGKMNAEEQREIVMIIENSIIMCRSFFETKALPNWSEEVKKDFRFVDLSLIESVAPSQRT